MSASTIVTGVDFVSIPSRHMAFFTDPDGNRLMLHHHYAPRG